MIGRNTLVLNKATMIQALEFWLKSQMMHPPKVEDVKEVIKSMETTFHIDTVMPESGSSSQLPAEIAKENPDVK